MNKLKLYLSFGAIVALCGLLVLHYKDAAKISNLSTRNKQLNETVQLQQQKINNTTEQLKNADKIKIKYKEFKSDDEACNYVMHFNIAKCLH